CESRTLPARQTQEGMQRRLSFPRDLLRGCPMSRRFCETWGFFSALLRNQECGESSGIFVTHGAIRLDRAGTQSLRIFHPLVDPGRCEARAHVRQGWTDVALIGFGVHNVAALARVLA